MNDLAQHHKRGPRKHHVNFAAKFTSNGEAHGMDLGPRLNVMLCRTCGQPVDGLYCQREACRKARDGGK